MKMKLDFLTDYQLDRRPRELFVPNDNSRILVACALGISRSFDTAKVAREKFGIKGIVVLSGGIYGLQDYLLNSENRIYTEPNNFVAQRMRSEIHIPRGEYYNEIAKQSIEYAFCFADLLNDGYSARDVKQNYLPFLLPKLRARTNARVDIRETSSERVAEMIFNKISQ